MWHCGIFVLPIFLLFHVISYNYVIMVKKKEINNVCMHRNIVDTVQYTMIIYIYIYIYICVVKLRLLWTYLILMLSQLFIYI